MILLTAIVSLCYITIINKDERSKSKPQIAEEIIFWHNLIIIQSQWHGVAWHGNPPQDDFFILIERNNQPSFIFLIIIFLRQNIVFFMRKPTKFPFWYSWNLRRKKIYIKHKTNELISYKKDQLQFSTNNKNKKKQRRTSRAYTIGSSKGRRKTSWKKK